MKQKIVFTDKPERINDFIDKGWIVKSIIPQSVGGGGSSWSSNISGGFVFLLEKSPE